MPLLFAVTLFASASLMFMVQPMVGKMVLPLLGGSPAVWNACMVFFQALLLLGYLYAHKLSSIESPRRQWAIHMAVLALPMAVFAFSAASGGRNSPIAIVESLAPTDGGSPILSVLAILTVAIGIPFFVVSTTATLLQKWFVFTGHPSARDPYFLYSASNIGSLISLLGYPLVVEPRLAIVSQAWLFAVGFAALAVLIYFCGRAAANPVGVPPPAKGAKPAAAAPAAVPEPPPTLARKLKWVALAFVPSTLMLGVTFHMTTDIASIPLLWVGPLALYLITFIIAFGRVPDWFRVVVGNLAPVMILLLVFVMISGVKPGTGVELLLYNLTFFAAALMCHYELARDRPSPQYLTEFFLLMSVGGVLGGVFNSLVAPLVFPQAYEFPIALIFACLLVPKLTDTGGEEAAEPPPAAGESDGLLARARRGFGGDTTTARVLDVVLPVLVGVAFYYFTRLSTGNRFVGMCESIASTINLSAETVRVILLYAVPVMVCFFFVDRPLRFALCVAAILGPVTYRQSADGVVHSERSFFGILKVQEDYSPQLIKINKDDGTYTYASQDGKVLIAGQYKFRKLVHGTTLHGTQVAEHDRHFLDDFQMLAVGANPWDAVAVAAVAAGYDARQEPLTYYHRTGPVGAILSEMRTRKGGADAGAHFAMVGLGTGSVSCYALPGQRLTFYEIDPAVKKLVADTDQYFTYVKGAEERGAKLDFRMGDARLKLKDDTDRFTVLLVDAFSSDSIPVHLLTTEAVRLYFDRLADDGILALHISNKYVRLEPVVAAIVQELRRADPDRFAGLTARVWNDDAEKRPGKTASSWVVLARRPEDLGRLYAPTGDLMFGPPAAPGADDRMRVSMDSQLFRGLVEEFDELSAVTDRRTKYKELNESPPDQVKGAWLGWVEDRLRRESDPAVKARLGLYRDLIDRHSPFVTFQEAMVRDHGHAFRRVETMSQVPAWTDDYSDVMRVMMIPELQRVRKFFGLPTPVER